MIWRILKNDLKRKRVLNVIMLLFVILCAMFASASANNIVAVTRGVEHYFDLAEVPDLVVTISGESDAEEKIRALPSVTEVKEEKTLCIPAAKYFRYKGKALDNFINPAYAFSDAEMLIRYFDENNQVIESVPEGCFYATSVFANDTDIRKGDEVVLDIGDTKLTLKYSGTLKGALFFTGNTSASPFLLLNAVDYDTLNREPEIHVVDHLNDGVSYYIKTAAPAEVQALAERYENVSVATRDSYKAIYIYDMITAYIVMVISILLMVVAFAVLRFTIGFTISEEFREIGVMKAVGIDNGSIRMLYIVKYLAIAVAGAAIGFFGSVPLGDVLLKTAVKNMVLSSGSSKIIGLLSSAAVVVIILLFCYLCTRRVRKLSPTDAVRNGQTGERFGKKSILHLGRSKLPSTMFLAANDVLSSPKQFGIITAVFTLCLLLMIVLANATLTLKSEKLLQQMNVPAGDVHILDIKTLYKAMGDADTYRQLLSDTEKKLSDNRMPGACSITLTTYIEIAHGNKKTGTMFFVTKGYLKEDLPAYKGSAPQKANEIMLTKKVMQELDVQIGDTVTAQIGSRKETFIVTGEFSSFIPGAYLFHEFDFGDQIINGCLGLQIHFDGNPDSQTIRDRIETLKKLYESKQVYTSAEMVATSTGISDTLNSIKQMMMLLTVIVTLMIVILMERSFISKEKTEIAFMKAAGISDGSVIAQHTMRFALVATLACLIASGIGIPLSNAVMNWICSMPGVGDVSGIACEFDPVEIFLICPTILIGVTVVGSFLTALYIKKIKAYDTASIE